MASIIVQIAEWILAKLFILGRADYAQWKANRLAAKDEQTAETNLKKAVTGEQVDKATDDTLNKL